MCYFCFDVLYCHLYNLQPPQVNSRLMAFCINGKWIVVAPFRTLSTLKLWILTAANKLQQCRVSSLCHLEDWKGPEAARWDHMNLEMIVPEFTTQCWIGTLNNNLEHQAALEPSMTWSCITAWGSTLSPLPWRTPGKSLANQGPFKLKPSY